MLEEYITKRILKNIIKWIGIIINGNSANMRLIIIPIINIILSIIISVINISPTVLNIKWKKLITDIIKGKNIKVIIIDRETHLIS